MEICGRQLDAAVIERIVGIVDSAPADSRRALSRRICEAMNRRSASGRLQEMSCRKVLNSLALHGVISLPEIKETYSFHQSAARPQLDVPSIKEAVFMIAKLGGFFGRNSDGNPGTQSVWRGLQRLEDIVIGFKAAEAFYQRAGP